MKRAELLQLFEKVGVSLDPKDLTVGKDGKCRLTRATFEGIDYDFSDGPGDLEFVGTITPLFAAEGWLPVLLSKPEHCFAFVVQPNDVEAGGENNAVAALNGALADVAAQQAAEEETPAPTGNVTRRTKTADEITAQKAKRAARLEKREYAAAHLQEHVEAARLNNPDEAAIMEATGDAESKILADILGDEVDGTVPTPYATIPADGEWHQTPGGTPVRHRVTNGGILAGVKQIMEEDARNPEADEIDQESLEAAGAMYDRLARGEPQEGTATIGIVTKDREVVEVPIAPHKPGNVTAYDPGPDPERDEPPTPKHSTRGRQLTQLGKLALAKANAALRPQALAAMTQDEKVIQGMARLIAEEFSWNRAILEEVFDLAIQQTHLH